MHLDSVNDDTGNLTSLSLVRRKHRGLQHECRPIPPPLPNRDKPAHGSPRQAVARDLRNRQTPEPPPIAALTAASFVYLAVFSSRNKSSPLLVFRGAPYSCAGFYASAALLTVSIVPFTMVAMSLTNDALIDVCEAQDQGAPAGATATDPEIEALLRDWVSLNRVRSLLPLIASLTGIAAALL